MSKTIMLTSIMAKSYIGGYDDALGFGQTNSYIALAQKKLSDINLLEEFNKIRLEDDNVKAVPIRWLAEFWNGLRLVYPLEDHRNGLSRKIGRSWWQGGSPLNLRYWDYPWLHTLLSDELMKSIRNGIYTVKPKESRLTALRFALETLATFFHDHFYCDIEVRVGEDRSIVFHVIKTPLTDNEDPNFRVFWGVLDGFCLWLRSPYYDKPLYHIDEELSTFNQIIIRHYKVENTN